MKKVVFSVIKGGKSENKLTGVGYITDTELLVPAISRNGKPYIRVFEDAIERCKPLSGKTDEFKGTITEYHNIDVEKFTSSGASTGYETKEVEITYYIWFKYAD